MVEIQNRIKTRLDVITQKEITSLSNFKGLCDDREGFLKSVSMLASGLNVKSFTTNIGNKKFDAWLENNFLNIQDTSKKGTEEGLLQIESMIVKDYFQMKIETTNNSIKFEGAVQDTIPEEAKHIFNAAVLEAYRLSSTYFKEDSRVNIEIHRESLYHLPEWHLNKLMSLGNFQTLGVRYEGERGSDLGGLKREYIGKLASIISGRELLFAEVDGSLKIPRIFKDQKDAILYCDRKEAEVYQNFGKLFSLCYNSKQMDPDQSDFQDEIITTGRLFSDVLFKAAFSLSSSDLNAPFIDQQEAQIKMSKIILTYLDRQSSDTVKNMIRCFDLLEKDNLEKCLIDSKDNLRDELVLAHAMLGEDGEVYGDEIYQPDVAKITENIDEFKEALLNAIMKDSKLVDELNGVPLGSILDPIYQIAMGMSKNLSNWDAQRTGPVDVFSSKIQGSIDRDQIVASIDLTLDDRVLDQKVIWLKEWIQDASDVEIKSFLKFVTGSTSLAGTTKIKIDDQVRSRPFASASTCEMTLHISDRMAYPTMGDNAWGEDQWDNTKESFIRNLKGFMSVEGFQNM